MKISVMAWRSDEEWLNWVDVISEIDYVVIDNFLPLDLLQTVDQFFVDRLREEAFQKAAVGSLEDRTIVSEIRGDYTYWLDRNRDLTLTPFFSIVDEMMYIFNRYCFLNLRGSEFHLAEYPPKSFYKKHLDQFKGRNNRTITYILYLNQEWKKEDGGQLAIYQNKKQILIEPIYNRAIIFKSDQLMHEVLPTEKYRRSLTGWLLYQPPVLGQLLT